MTKNYKLKKLSKYFSHGVWVNHFEIAAVVMQVIVSITVTVRRNIEVDDIKQ